MILVRDEGQVGPNEKMNDRSQWEAKLDGKDRSFSENIEKQAEMINGRSRELLEGNCKVRLPAPASPNST